MSKSKKTHTESTGTTESEANSRSGRRAFLRNAGVAMAAAGLAPLAKAQDEGGNLSVNVVLDAEKVAAIQNCLAKGTLQISMSAVDATSGKPPTQPWNYD